MVIKVNTDGSGTLEKTVFYSNEDIKQTVEAQQTVAAAPANSNIDPKPFEVEIYNPELLEEDAKAMGDGVQLVSAKRIEDEKGKGFKATFSFSDINQLRLDRTPEHHPVGEGKVRMYNASSQPVRFHFAKGPPAELTLTFNRPAPEPPGKNNDAEAENQARKIRDAMKGTRDFFSVEVQGKVLETNATFQEGSRIVIDDMDFDKILTLPKEKLDVMRDLSPASLRGLGLNPEKGMREEWSPEVKVKFQ